MMRRKGLYGPFVMITAITVLMALSVPPLYADTNPGQPTVRELIEKSPKEHRSSESLSQQQLGIQDDPLGRGVPRSTVHGFLIAARNRNYAQAAEYLDLRNLPVEVARHEGSILARQLKVVLDRALLIDLDLLSNSPEGDRNDNLHPARDRVGSISSGSKTYDIFIQRILEEDGAFIWKFAGVTVADIPSMYKDFGYGGVEQILPAWLFDVSFLGLNLWLWIAVLGLAILLYPAAMLITSLLVLILRRFHADLAQQVERVFTGPLRLLIWTILVRASSDVVGPSITLRAISQARTVQVIALGWLLLRVIDFVALRASTNLDRKGLGGALVLLSPVARLLKLLVVTAAMLLWLDNVGFKVTTLLAGLSISGIAVALASQKTLENIFGAFTLFAAQPVRVGDFCRFGTQVGTVEEIGLRATRIRTLERSVITIANADFVSMHLDNLSKRDRFWYHPHLSLRYETTPDQIRYVLVEVQKMLYAHPKVLSEPLHVRFKGFGEYSLDLEVFAYMGVSNYDESLEVAEDLNLRIMEIVRAAGSDFAVPTQIQYELPGHPIDEHRAQGVAEEVKNWKSKHTLYLPNFPKEKIAEVKDTLDYPPVGSPDSTVPRDSAVRL